MGDDLVAEEIEVDPLGGAAALRDSLESFRRRRGRRRDRRRERRCERG